MLSGFNDHFLRKFYRWTPLFYFLLVQEKNVPPFFRAFSPPPVREPLASFSFMLSPRSLFARPPLHKEQVIFPLFFVLSSPCARKVPSPSSRMIPSLMNDMRRSWPSRGRLQTVVFPLWLVARDLNFPFSGPLFHSIYCNPSLSSP